MQIVKKENKIVITPTEKIDITNANKFKRKIISFFKERSFEEDISIDFSHVERIDSTGLGKLLLLHSKVRESGGRLRIINVSNEYIRKKFSLINIDQVIEVI